MYSCRCGKEYKSKTWFQNHRALCELLHDSKKDEDDIYDDLPSKIEMWNCMKVILKKYETLENKIQDHEKYIKKLKRKISIIDWLRDNCKPEIEYNNWISNINVGLDDLEIMFNSGFIDSIHRLFMKYLPLCDKLPIKCFDQKMYVFFVYRNYTWEHLDFEDYEKLVHNISGKFIKTFKIWKDQNKKLIDNDKNNELVQKRYFEVMGGRYDDETNIKKLNSKLYKYLKVNLRNIVTYEFSF
jgi:hypothetical protein